MINEPACPILLVEDDERLALMIRDFLTPEGFDVTVEGRGDAAVTKILNDAPEAVILDVNLPGMDGISVCRAVRSAYSGPILILMKSMRSSVWKSERTTLWRSPCGREFCWLGSALICVNPW